MTITTMAYPSISHHPFSIKYNEKLRVLNDYKINSYLDIIENLDNQIKDVSKKILLIAKQDEMAKLLMIHSRDWILFCDIDNIRNKRSISHFPDSYHLCSFAGLVPSTHSSGGVTYHGNITKTGSKYLRWIMLECAHAHIRTEKSSNITQFYERLSKKKGSPKAYVSAVSKLLKIVYWVMKERKEYQPPHSSPSSPLSHLSSYS